MLIRFYLPALISQRKTDLPLWSHFSMAKSGGEKYVTDLPSCPFIAPIPEFFQCLILNLEKERSSFLPRIIGECHFILYEDPKEELYIKRYILTFGTSLKYLFVEFRFLKIKLSCNDKLLDN